MAACFGYPTCSFFFFNSFKIECFHIFQDEDDHHESRLESACSEHNSKEYTMMKNVASLKYYSY